MESIVYPKYETKGELEQATEAFVEWYADISRWKDPYVNTIIKAQGAGD